MKRLICLAALGVLVAMATPSVAQESDSPNPGFATQTVEYLGSAFPQQCKDVVSKVALRPTEERKYDLWGRLCGPVGDLTNRTVMVLIHGGTYNHHYNDWPYRPEYYSFVRAATRAGYATLNLDRIGHGNSDHRPSSFDITFETSANTIHFAVQDLKSGAAGYRFGKVIFVGHSFGEMIARVYAAHYDDIDGMVISGAQHLGTYAKIASVFGNIFYPAQVDPTIKSRSPQVGDTTSRPGSRCDTFYHRGYVEPEVCALDEKLKDTITQGEFSTFRESSNIANTSKIKVPVLHVMGEYDFFWCATFCSNPNDFAQQEYRFYPASACFETWIEPDSGHMNNLHIGAPRYYAKAIEWADRRVGLTANAPASDCKA